MKGKNNNNLVEKDQVRAVVKKTSNSCICCKLDKYNTTCKSCKCSKNLAGCTISCKCKGRCGNTSNTQGNDRLFFKVFRNIVLRRQITDPDGTTREKIKRAEELQKLKDARRDAIIKKLSEHNLALRPDSKLCYGYIDGTLDNSEGRTWSIDSIVQEMCIMKYLYEYCNLSQYWDRVKSSIFDEDYAGPEYKFIYRNDKRNILETAKHYCILDHPLPLNRNYPWIIKKQVPSILNRSLLNPTLNRNITTTTTTATTIKPRFGPEPIIIFDDDNNQNTTKITFSSKSEPIIINDDDDQNTNITSPLLVKPELITYNGQIQLLL